jgi:hypothetical protein
MAHMRFLFVALFCSGCIAASVKAHTGVVADERGRGVQAGVSLGIGIAGKRSAVIESVGFAGGQAPKAGLAIGLDYLRLPEDSSSSKLGFGWRVGIGGVPLAYGNPATMGVRFATLFIVRDKSESDGHEKMFSGSTRNVRAFGVEAMLGMSTHDQFEPMPKTAFGGTASLTYEWHLLSRVW